jgi:hypothetical protein
MLMAAMLNKIFCDPKKKRGKGGKVRFSFWEGRGRMKIYE